MTRNRPIRGIQISISTGRSKKVLVKKYWYRYWYWQYFLRQVLILVLPILSKSIVNNPGTCHDSFSRVKLH